MPEPEQRRPKVRPDWDELTDLMRLGDYTEESCTLLLFGCKGKTKLRLVPDFEEVRKLPRELRQDSRLYTHLCDNCWKVMVSILHQFKAKTTWVNGVSYEQRMSPANVRKEWDRMIPAFNQKMKVIMELVSEVMANSGTFIVKVEVGQPWPLTPGKTLYVDITTIQEGYVIAYLSPP